ncbi:MAG: Hsp20/alpha crystallin family protein [Gammaproteobacteria bacterium]
MLARVYRDPMDTFREFSGELDRMFNTNAAGYTDTATDWVPAVDIKEAKDAYEVVADVPGVEPKDIDVSLEDGVLTVKGERKSESTDKGTGFTRTERAYGSFYRRFTLPDTADADKITAKTEHGVLKLHIPKKEKVLPKKISVEG